MPDVMPLESAVKPRPESSDRGGPLRTGKCPELPTRSEMNGATHARPGPHLVPGRKSRTQCQTPPGLREKSLAPDRKSRIRCQPTSSPRCVACDSARTGSEEQDPVPRSDARTIVPGRKSRTPD